MPQINADFLKVRREKGLTQEQVAEQAGCRQVEVSLIEAQAWTPPPALQERLAEVLESDIESLFGSAAVRGS